MHRIGRWVLVVIGLALVVVAFVVGVDLLRAEPVPTFAVERPRPGEARPDYLADGTPVFVVGHDDGTVSVVSAFDTHTPYNLGKLNWWCSTAGVFENPNHGSRWDEYGVRTGGPAPFDLATYEATVEGGRVLVGAARAGAQVGDRPPNEEESTLDWCLLPDDEDDVVFHRFEGWRVWDSPAEAVREAPTDRWILLAGQLAAFGGEAGVRLCALDSCDEAAPTTNVERAERNDRFGPLVGSRFIAHVRHGALVEVTRVVGLDDAAP